MKIATCKVNGIRARPAQLEEWMASQRPEILCLPEIKAAPELIPESLPEILGYFSYWHVGKGYSGVGLPGKKDFARERPEFSHPAFDLESRVRSWLPSIER